MPRCRSRLPCCIHAAQCHEQAASPEEGLTVHNQAAYLLLELSAWLGTYSSSQLHKQACC